MMSERAAEYEETAGGLASRLILIRQRKDLLTALKVTVAMAEDFLTDTTQDRDNFLTALDGARAAIAKVQTGKGE